MPASLAPSTLPMAGGQPISEAVADQAAEWLTVLMSGAAGDAERQRWQQWRGAHPDHERAWRHIETVTQRLKLLDASAGYQALSPYGHAAGLKPPGRRKALKLLLWGGAVGVTGVLASRTQAWQQQVADYRTGTGEQRSVTLADGSRIVLNTASAIDVRFDARSRLLRLVAGDILVVTVQARRDVAHAADDPRPFVVETAEGRIRALGTRFSVRQQDGYTAVGVQESAVEITPVDGGARRILRAGERASFTRRAIETPQALGASDEAWTRGQIVAENTRLDEFLAELDRYRPGVLRCDPAVAGLRLSGVFPLQDIDRILATLPSVLPVRVQQRTRWWILVAPLS